MSRALKYLLFIATIMASPFAEAESTGVTEWGAYDTVTKCVRTLGAALSRRIPQLNFEDNLCEFDTETRRHTWSYTYKGKEHTNRKQPSRTDTDCANEMASSLNLHITGVDVTLPQRCHKDLKGFASYRWKFIYSGEE